MGLGKNITVVRSDKGKYSIFGKGTNTSNENNFSHKSGIPTNFNLAAISLMDIDMGVWQEFNNRFVINDKNMALMIGDAETTSLPMMNYENFDQDKGFLNWPFFVYTRTDTKKMLRTNPSFKQVLFAVPVMKPQGIVIEEYISEGPINYELLYDFVFVTYFREEANDMEQQINHYFRNKRNVIVVCNERFSIGPASQDQVCTLEMVSRNDASQMTMYVLTIKLKMWAWTRRGTEDMQKRERPNNFSVNFSIADGRNKLINVDNVVIVQDNKPTDLIDPT